MPTNWFSSNHYSFNTNLYMIHTQLKTERLKREITVRKLAELMAIKSKKGNVTWHVIQRIENGQNVNYSSYVRYAAALGLVIETNLKQL